MDPHSGMTGLDMLGSPHSDGMSSGHSMSSSLPISSSVSVDPHSHPSAQLAVNAAAHHSAMYGHSHSAATSMMSPHTSLVHSHHPHHHHTPVVSMQDTDTDPRFEIPIYDHYLIKILLQLKYWPFTQHDIMHALLKRDPVIIV